MKSTAKKPIPLRNCVISDKELCVSRWPGAPTIAPKDLGAPLIGELLPQPKKILLSINSRADGGLSCMDKPRELFAELAIPSKTSFPIVVPLPRRCYYQQQSPVNFQQAQFVYLQQILDFWTDPGYVGKQVDIMIPPHRFQEFNESFVANTKDFFLLTDDVQKLIDEENEFLNSPEPVRQKRSLISFFRKYHNLEEVYEFLNQLAGRFHRQMSVETVGTTFLRKQLKLVKLSSNPSANKPIIWIDAGIHGREWIAPSTALYFILKILIYYGHDEHATKLLDTYDWYVMPVANPDGYAYTFTRKANELLSIADRLQRDPRSPMYMGPRALSELETQAIVRILTAVKSRVKLYLSLHSFGQYIVFPWASERRVINEYHEMKRIGMRAAEAIRNFTGMEYTAGSVIELLYPATGVSLDWAYADLGIKHSFAIELRDKGQRKFKLSTKYIIPVGAETWKAICSIITDIEG
ncbi:carboxypeptidase B-like [Centruroides vittatus]|uniref:carboxypeptidase B-like n=1 Tax=Centruroides vittatus TaxID=120091 RepID=UPI00350FB11E